MLEPTNYETDYKNICVTYTVTVFAYGKPFLIIFSFIKKDLNY